MTEELIKLIDNRNKQIFDEIIQNNYTVELKDKDNNQKFWSVNIKDENVSIYKGKKKDDINAFTHELLHVIQEIRGQFSHEMLPIYVATFTSVFISILNDSTVNHINNVILHDRMIVDFEQLKFPRNKFIVDYYYKPRRKKENYNLIINEDIELLKLQRFLSDFFCYRFHPNKHVKAYYKSTIINQYAKCNPELVEGLEEISRRWEISEIKENNVFFTELLNCLNNWKELFIANQKIITPISISVSKT